MCRCSCRLYGATATRLRVFRRRTRVAAYRFGVGQSGRVHCLSTHLRTGLIGASSKPMMAGVRVAKRMKDAGLRVYVDDDK